MYSFNQPATPAAKSHLNAQLSFFNDISKSIFQSAQKISELNINLAQKLIEESTHASQEILTAKEPVEALSATAAQVHPVTEKIRSYQQHLTRIAADAQVNLSKCAEEHVQETSRTARALADEVVKTTTEEIEQVRQRQLDAARKTADQVNEWQGGNNNTQQDSNFNGGQNRSSSDSAGSAHAGASQPSTQGSTKQAGASQADAQPGSGKQASSSRKES
jgi:phasin family protein